MMPVKAVSFLRPRQAWIRAGVTVHRLAKARTQLSSVSNTAAGVVHCAVTELQMSVHFFVKLFEYQWLPLVGNRTQYWQRLHW
jgi:hypothetical protein